MDFVSEEKWQILMPLKVYVSILIVMDFVSEGHICIRIFCFYSSFNPYCNGFCFRRLALLLALSVVRRFNPYCNGFCFRRPLALPYRSCRLSGVSILIVMDFVSEAIFVFTSAVTTFCFNPYCNGFCFRRDRQPGERGRWWGFQSLL